MSTEPVSETRADLERLLGRELRHDAVITEQHAVAMASRVWNARVTHQPALPGGWAALMARGDARARDAFGPNTARLMSAKAAYDPDGVFAATPLPR
jgi:Berberine and berberine like